MIADQLTRLCTPNRSRVSTVSTMAILLPIEQWTPNYLGTVIDPGAVAGGIELGIGETPDCGGWPEGLGSGCCGIGPGSVVGVPVGRGGFTVPGCCWMGCRMGAPDGNGDGSCDGC